MRGRSCLGSRGSWRMSQSSSRASVFDPHGRFQPVVDELERVAVPRNTCRIARVRTPLCERRYTCPRLRKEARPKSELRNACVLRRRRSLTRSRRRRRPENSLVISAVRWRFGGYLLAHEPAPPGADHSASQASENARGQNVGFQPVGVGENLGFVRILAWVIVAEQPHAAAEGIGIVAEPHIARQLFHVLGISAAEHHVIDHERGF